MNIIIEKNNDKFYAVIKNLKNNIYKYRVQKSWDKVFACENLVVHNLIEHKIDLYNKPINLLDFSIELEPITSPKDYYTITLITEDMNEYPFYIDINKFYNLKQEEKIYFYNFEDGEIILDSSPSKKYDFYLLGNFNDVHKAKLLQIVNKNYILFTIPDYDEYISEVYYLVVELNEKKIYKCNFPLLKKYEPEFAIGVEDYGQYLKYTVSPKYNYSFLKELSIKNNERILVKKTKNSSNKSFIKNISFYLPNPGVNNFSEFLISYKTQENYINSEYIEHNLLIKKSLYSKEEINITDFKYEYDFKSDNYKFSWNNKFLGKINYKITFDDYYIFYTSSNSLNISNISEKRNLDKEYFKFKIECDVYNNFYTLFEKEIENYYFIDSPINFKPIIDYSEALLDNAKTAIIRWTNPQYKYTSKIKLEVKFLKLFLNEYIEPWNNEYILDKEGIIFDQKYPDYTEELAYDFDINGEFKYKSVNDSSISNINTLEYIDIGERNNFEIPIWFCENDTNYKISVQIYDRWGKLRGSNSVQFTINAPVKDLRDEDIWLDRNQFMQFGETGTVGEFYKIEKPNPVNVKFSYAPAYKKFNGQALYDYSNTDNNKNSLYYYLNSNEEDKDFIIKFKRNYNFYKLTYEVFYNQKIIVPLTEVLPQGNTFESNRFTISKKILKGEGEYIMNIRTFSSTGQESSIKEIKFYVYNDKPDTPIVEINSDDYSYNNNIITINKKYFSMSIINNEINKKYAGWNYKEAHFYFKSRKSTYNDYPDYVIQASKENGIISFKNTVSIENGEYSCKILAYDYSGNESEPYEFDFDLISHMSATPEALFTNKLIKPMKWEIKKSQDSEGYYRQFKFSSDGINYVYTDPEKIESPYHVDDPNTSQFETVSLYWIQDKPTQQFQEGFYQLVIYEWNYRHEDGLVDYKFESPVVEVTHDANPSNPINCKAIENKVAVFNAKSLNEYAYTSNLNDLVFETIHNEIVLDDPETEKKEGQFYKLKLIEPSTNNEYECTLPTPTEVGMFTFTEIAKQCKIANQTEGVWEIRFITVDKAGNDNAYKGYYTYFVNVVKRNPRITSLSLTNSNGSEYFGLNSNTIGLNVETNAYDDISNFKEHIEKFNVTRFQISFLSTPLNSQYSIYVIKDSKGIIKIMDPLTENEKRIHNKDGRYLINVRAIDPIGRYSNYVEKTFYIDTDIDCNLSFLTPDIFYNRSITLFAASNEQASRVYYKIIDENTELDKENYLEWDKVEIGEITYNNSVFNGCQFKEMIFDSDGRKTLAYKVEEISGNITDILFYNFLIDSSVKIAPIFDFDNKVFYTPDDDEIYISWNLSSSSITNYSIKLDKIELKSSGEIVVVKSYDFSTTGDGLLVPVGPEENHYIDWQDRKYCSFLIKENNFLVDGLYRLTVKSLSKYGDLEINDFKFQINTSNLVNIADQINKNTITIDSNVISWNHIILAMYYEVSYDNKTFIRTTNNSFIIETEKLISDSNGNKCIYMRYRSKTGRLSESTKIILNVIMKKLEKPEVTFLNNVTVSDNNKLLEWVVTVKDPEVAKYIYYSFDNEKWNVTAVKGKTNIIRDDSNSFPIEDKEYSIYVRTTDEHPINSIYYSKSELSYAYVNIFASEIEKPIFLDLKSGDTLSEPKQLFITNKMDMVDYYIYVNDKLVYEGYEINSSTLKRFNIKVKAKKRGIDKMFELIKEQDDFHVFSLTNRKYVLNIKDEKINCYVDSNYIEIFSLNEKKENQIILYRDKDLKDDWKVLRVGDRLSLLNKWEFHITTFDIS